MLTLLALATLPKAPPRQVSDARLRDAEAVLAAERDRPGRFPEEVVTAGLLAVAFGRCERALDAGPLYALTAEQAVERARTAEEAVDLLGRHGGFLLRGPPSVELVFDGPVPAETDLGPAIEAWNAAESPSPEVVARLFAAVGKPPPDEAATLGLHVMRAPVEGADHAVLTLVSGDVAVSM